MVVLERPPPPDGAEVVAVGCEQRRHAVAVVAHQDGVRDAEHPLDLMSDRVEHTVWRRTFGNERRHAPQRRLLVGELASARFGGGELGAALGIRDRRCHELGELRDALLRVGRQGFAPVRDCHDAPEVALDDDRGGNGRDEVHLAEVLGDRARGVPVAGVVVSRGTAGAVDRGGGQEVLERPTGADRNDGDALGEADDDHRGSVGLEARDGGLGAEEPADLVGDRGEDIGGADSACDQRRHPPQRRLLVEEAANLVVCFAVHDRGRDELREVGQPVGRVRRQRRPVLRGTDRKDAPDRAVDDDRCSDDGAHAKRASRFAHGAVDAAVVLDA